MATVSITPANSTPVTLDEVKRHLRIDTDDEDVYLQDLIQASTNHLEAVSGLKLLTQTWRQFFDTPPADNLLETSLAPVQSVLEMRIYDQNGDAKLIDLTNVELDTVSVPVRLWIQENLASYKPINGIEIDFLVGFGDLPMDIPDSIRRALLLLIAHAYEFRGAIPASSQPASEPNGFKTLIAPFRRVRI